MNTECENEFSFATFRITENGTPHQFPIEKIRYRTQVLILRHPLIDT